MAVFSAPLVLHLLEIPLKACTQTCQFILVHAR